MVNAFRYGFLGVTDIPLWSAFGLVIAFVTALLVLSVGLLERGVGIRS